jgi:hypothetical protein
MRHALSLSALSLSALATTAVLLSGCPPVVCTEIAFAALTVSIQDTAGSPIDSSLLEVTFTVDGGGSTPCDDVGDGWVCGWETSGDLVVTARADGYEDAEATVTIARGECHVEGQTLTLTLDAAEAFETSRGFEHVLFEGTDCDDALANGVNCAMWLSFCPDGSAEIILTDIVNPGTYTLDTDGIDTSWEAGDAPAQMRFDWQGDDLVEETSGLVWTETDALPCD